ncbi:helix-turn-helix transcriptional regulator [Hansschlegelia plantiphila]|uniref:AraC family transcriptional regulator n=1 Tax=Hansschlegelia plantiphila TaxID=374655 RepID=A0A9W6MWY8_9HYPH|nr:helix-turn-helix transcriptional regulator [Hansschlegelia plantiphila]GLK69355.1 AraC family transcriptional regulator [Hansschlegelia plantiphila]
MYESAAPKAASLQPLWRLDAARTLFIGPLRYNASHQHGAPVFLSSLGGPFGLRLGLGPWLSRTAAMIPAGVAHELDLQGEPLAVLYLEPSVAGSEALAPLVMDATEAHGALVGRSAARDLFRELYENPDSLRWAGEALDGLLGFAAARTRRDIDRRIVRAVRMVDRTDDERPQSLSELACATGLSPSRLQHLFTEEVGVSFRRYRAWTRMRRAIGEIVAGANFTTAAHAAGFSDQAHFSHDFRRTFGAPASVSLSGVRR